MDSRLTPLLEIDHSQVRLLNDSDLRELVYRLCEAELQKFGHPISAIKAGGHQDAPDGGLDVIVSLPKGAAPLDFVLKPNTGFQTKISAFGPGRIEKEMKPKGKLRDSIRSLCLGDGAYVIVSAGSSTADSEYKKRHCAMLSALPKALQKKGTLDFYDGDRLSRWVNQHPAVILWLREKVKQPLIGWKGYGNWSNITQEKTEFLLDDKNRIIDTEHPQDGPLPILEGINRIRSILSRSKGAVRLVGVSGSGKTRLAQALFEAQIGKAALHTIQAIYCDMGDEPQPPPRELLEHWNPCYHQSILVIDNCPPELHRSLSMKIRGSNHGISLLTIEYDIKDDEPEETQVFHLDPCSSGVVEKLLEQRTPNVSQVNRRKIAELSDGNTCPFGKIA